MLVWPIQNLVGGFCFLSKFILCFKSSTDGAVVWLLYVAK